MDQSRKEIPQWTWYNGQLLFLFDEKLKENPDMTIAQFFKEFIENQKLQDWNGYHTKNQGTIILLLYGLLVIPREIWLDQRYAINFQPERLFTIIIGSVGLTSRKLIDYIRHSLAHANFTIDVNSGKFKFWSYPNPRSRIKNFEADVTYENLVEFITQIGKFYINEVLHG